MSRLRFHHEMTDESGKRIRVIGADRGHEIYSAEDVGDLNITAMQNDLDAHTANADLTYLPIDKALVEHVAKRDIDPLKLRSMPPYVIPRPIILVQRKDKTAYLVDGAHRVMLHISVMAPAIWAWLFYPDAHEKYKVRFWLKDHPGEPWSQIKATAETVRARYGIYTDFDKHGKPAGVRVDPNVFRPNPGAFRRKTPK